MWKNIREIKEEMEGLKRTGEKIIQDEIGKRVQENINNKEKLAGVHFKNWQRASTPEAKEAEMKAAGEKLLETIPGIKYDSGYFALYVAPDYIRDYYLENKNLELPVLYLEKFPKEFMSIMTLPEVKMGFSDGLKKIGNYIKNEMKNRNLKEGEKFQFKYDKNVKETVKLLFKGSLDWGTTALQINNISGTVTKKNGEYEVKVNYNPSLEDSFKDVPDLFNVEEGIREFKGGKPFLMKTKGIPSSYTFSVKNLDEIPEKLKKAYSSITRPEKLLETIKKVFKNLKQNVR